MVEIQTQEKESPEKKAEDFLAQLKVIGEVSETLKQEVEKLSKRKVNPDSEVGQMVRTIQKLQRALQVQITRLDFTVKDQGGFKQ